MSKSILDLPDDVLVELFARYVSAKDLCRLEQVCYRFHTILCQYPSPWRNHLARLTNVTSSQLKNAAGCRAFENIRPSASVPSHPFHLPATYHYEVLLDSSTDSHPILPTDYRRPLDHFNFCSKTDCDTYRLTNNYHSLVALSHNWTGENNYKKKMLVKFARRAQTSLLQYDEHHHQLWFTHDRALRCLDFDTKRIENCYAFHHDDVLCYKIYNEHLMCVANGDLLEIICRQSDETVPCQNDQHLPASPNHRNDILSLDVYSNNQERYVIVSGSRNHTVSMRTVDISSKVNRLVWRTEVDDRVLCSRFTSDGQHVLLGTGGTSSLYPLLLFNTERAQPIHFYDARYRLGAGVRCIEWASSNVFIAAGFDNQFKEFDIRTGKCHYTFSDEFGNDYSSLAVSADNNDVSNGIVLGGNHHSTVRLVNRRQRQMQKVFFVSEEASPVHSLAVTSEYLFASIDRSIVALDFTRSNRAFQLPVLHF